MKIYWIVCLQNYVCKFVCIHTLREREREKTKNMHILFHKPRHFFLAFSVVGMVMHEKLRTLLLCALAFAIAASVRVVIRREWRVPVRMRFYLVETQ